MLIFLVFLHETFVMGTGTLKFGRKSKIINFPFGKVFILNAPILKHLTVCYDLG